MWITHTNNCFIGVGFLKKYVDKKTEHKNKMWIIKSQRKKCTFNKILEFQAIKKITK